MHFTFAVTAAIVAYATVALCANGIPYELRQAANMDAKPLADDAQCAGKIRHCSTCTKLVTCLPSANSQGLSFVSEDACPSTSPYCVNDTCATYTEDSTCVSEQPSTFKCAKGVEGYLPDPKDCRVYHFCHDGKAYDYRCPDMSHMYNHEKAMCTMDGKGSKGSKCPIIDCTGQALKFVLYPGNPNVYALCQSDETPLLAKCDDNFQFNVTTTSCERVCDHEGRQSDPADPSKYVECVQGKSGKFGNKFQIVMGRCPAGTKFDRATERCRA